MKEIIIKNDKELKKIKNDGNIYVLTGKFNELIDINFDKSIIKIVDSKIESIEDSTINNVRGNSTINYVMDNSTINDVSGDSTINYVMDNSTINYVSDNSTINNVSGDSTINNVWGNSTINYVSGDSTINYVWGNSTINYVSGNSTINYVWGNSTINDVIGNSTINYVSDNSTINNVSGNSTINYVMDNSTINGFIGCNVVIRAYNKKNIKSKSKFVFIKLSKTKNVDWFINNYPVEQKNNKLVLYKAVHKINDKYFSDYDKDFEYKIGEIIEHECSDNRSSSCGVGLHLAHKSWCKILGKHWEDFALLKCEVDKKDLVVANDCDGKVRTGKLKVLCEVKE